MPQPTDTARLVKLQSALQVPMGHEQAERPLETTLDTPPCWQEQTRSRVAVPAVCSLLLTLHTLQGMQLPALSLALKVPAAHAAHTRSSVSEGALVTNVPAGHEVQATHGVAALPS